MSLPTILLSPLGLKGIGMITQEELQPYLDDYRNVVNEHTDLFIDPITLKPCRVRQICRAHILNKALTSASRKTIFADRDVDSFYGGKIESELINFLNLKDQASLDLVLAQSNVEVELPDGTKYEGFICTTTRARDEAAKRFPIVILDAPNMWMAVKTSRTALMSNFDDKTLRVSFVQKFMPAAWAAGMVKFAYFALFDLLGYKYIYDALGQTVRHTLNQFYQERGEKKDIPKIFHDFTQATKMIGLRTLDGRVAPATPDWMSFDSIVNRTVLFHYTPSDTMFAVSLIFDINGLKVVSSLPVTLNNERDAATAWEWYGRFGEATPEFKQIIRLGQFDGQHVKVNKQSLPIKMYSRNDPTITNISLPTSAHL